MTDFPASFALTPSQRRITLGLAGFCLILPNGIFLYGFLAHPVQLFQALFHNPISLAALLSMAVLTVGLAWMIRTRGFRWPGWILFLVMTLVGGLAFAVFAFLLLADGRTRNHSPEPAPDSTP